MNRKHILHERYGIGGGVGKVHKYLKKRKKRIIEMKFTAIRIIYLCLVNIVYKKKKYHVTHNK